jgi:hypothetical protein
MTYPTIAEAIQALKDHPGTSVVVVVDSLLVEMRVQRQRTADDVFGEIGPWEGESREELTAMLAKAREEGTSNKVPEF